MRPSPSRRGQPAPNLRTSLAGGIEVEMHRLFGIEILTGPNEPASLERRECARDVRVRLFDPQPADNSSWIERLSRPPRCAGLDCENRQRKPFDVRQVTARIEGEAGVDRQW